MDKNKLFEFYRKTREQTMHIVAELETEDFVVQPATFVSPPKWHLGHTTWFFENIILEKFCPAYKKFDPSFDRLFNSYYKSLGEHWIQGERGFLSRPTVKNIFTYREHVDQAMKSLLEFDQPHQELQDLVEIGLHHEQQHQELLLMDIKYILGVNPSMPALVKEETPVYQNNHPEWISQNQGVHEFGMDKAETFFFDNEGPRHQQLIQDHEISTRLVNQGEYLNFILDQGYNQTGLWLSQGWDWVQQNKIQKPLYWFKQEDRFFEYTLHGARPLDLDAPVSHVNYFEADAFSRWSGCRLPTEFESELFLQKAEEKFEDDDFTYNPKSSQIIFNNLWWWTSSSYQAYPGFTSFPGSLGEYNGKFMCNQYVLKGGCFATPKGHIRRTYRNFYYPEQNWMFSGIRLAR